MSKVAMIGGGILMAAWCWSAMAQQPTTTSATPRGLAAPELITYAHDQPVGPVVLTVIEPKMGVLAVYHVARETGEIKLKSVRNFALDLQLSNNFNSGSPTPAEIQKMLHRQP